MISSSKCGPNARAHSIACAIVAVLFLAAPVGGAFAGGDTPPSPAPAPNPQPSPTPTPPQPQNDVPGTGQKMFNPAVAEKLNGYMKRMNDAIKACDKAAYDQALKDFNYFVERGFEQGFDPFYKQFDDINHNSEYRENRRAVKFGRVNRDNPLYRTDHPNEYVNKSEYDADRAAMKAIKPPPFPDVCQPQTVPVTPPSPHENPKTPGKKSGLFDDLHISVGIGVGVGGRNDSHRRDKDSGDRGSKDSDRGDKDSHDEDSPPPHD